jgi:Raf kinase inhibitor-like YbhB/YbcL family protein
LVPLLAAIHSELASVKEGGTVATHLSGRLAWDAPNFEGPGTLALTSFDFVHGGPIPLVHAAARAGGKNLSPSLTWTPPPEDAAQLLLIVEDPDAPTRVPYLHCLALVDASATDLKQGALNPPPISAVSLARSAAGNGYLGPAPPKTNGPHRYVFQLFALAVPLSIDSKTGALGAAELTNALPRAGQVLSRGRLDGMFQRG